MALPYATPGQLEQLKKELEKKIKTSGSGSSTGNITKVSELENDAGYITESALEGYATTTALDEVKKSIPVVADFATKEQLDEVKESIPSIEGLATTEEVSEATKDVVKYQSFQNENDPASRKTIQLANHDTISGIGTDGQGYNIAMVSKWDKVDLGAAGLSINLNGKDARPTYNDEKEIALVEDIPDVSSLATKEEVEAVKTSIPSVENLATKEEVEEVKESIPSIDELATKEELSEAVENTVKYQSFQNPNDDAPRKTILLANHDTISGADTTGVGRNLIMLSKWDKVDVGAAGVSINLNGKDPRPTYNDDKELALKEDIPDISNLASKQELSELEGKIPTVPDTSSFATKKELEGVKESIPSVEGLVSEETLASTIGEERKAITKEIETSISNLVTNETFTTTLGDYALKSELPNTEEFVKESELPDFSTYALKTEIPEVDDFATKTEVNALIKTVGEGLQVGDSEHTTNINTTADNKVMINSVGEVVYSTPYPGEPTRKVIQLKNNDQLSGVTTTGAGVPLVFVSKWDKVEVGGNGAPLNLNGSAERPTYNDDKELALLEDIPDLMSVGMYYPGVKVDSQKLFALTKESTETDIKAALQLEAATGGYKLPTAAMLDDCLGKGYQLLSNWMPVSIAWNGAAYVFYTVGQNYMMKPTGLYTVALKITPEGHYSVFQAAKVEEFADVNDLEWLPVICNMNFRTLADKVYSQDEIFAWFFVKDLPSLKNTVIKHPIYLRYGISLSGNPMYYYIPCQYVAFTDANTLEMITDGLDTKNDKFSRYHITIKLDGTVINKNSNIKVELKENVFVPDLPEDAETKTYQLKAVNGTLTWVE